jgi:hypothetical protein
MPELPAPPVSLELLPTPCHLTRSPLSCGCPASAQGGARARHSLASAPRLPVTPRQACRPARSVRVGAVRTCFARRPRQPAWSCRTRISSGMGRLAGPQRVGPLRSLIEQWSFPFSISFILNQIQFKTEFYSNPINFGSNFGI